MLYDVNVCIFINFIVVGNKHGEAIVDLMEYVQLHIQDFHWVINIFRGKSEQTCVVTISADLLDIARNH